MVKTISVADVQKLVYDEKKLHHKNVSIKVFQVEFFSDRHPKVLLQTLDLEKTKSELIALGFSVSETKTEQSITTTVRRDKVIPKVRNLKTTNLVIGW